MNNLIVKEMEEFKLRQNIADELISIDKEEKELKEKKEKIREILLKEMEDKNILKLENENISITYKAPTERETYRTKDFTTASAVVLQFIINICLTTTFFLKS